MEIKPTKKKQLILDVLENKVEPQLIITFSQKYDFFLSLTTFQ